MVDPENFYAVVKTDAYGHGIKQVFDRLFAQGQRLFCVDSLDEALQIRHKEAQIFIMSPLCPSDLVKACDEGFIPFVSRQKEIEVLSSLARPPEIVFHCDIGMNRFGFTPSQRDAALDKIQKNALKVHSVSTHLAQAEDFVEEGSQMALSYDDFLKWVSDHFPKEVKVQALNTKGLLSCIKKNIKPVGCRIGLGLYGWSGSKFLDSAVSLKPVMRFKAPVVAIKDVQKGQTVSYGGLWTAQRQSRLAIVAVGYGNGLAGLEFKFFELGPDLAPVVGQITMGYTILDITDINKPLNVGDSAVVFGSQKALDKDLQLYWAMTAMGRLNPRKCI